jgi:superfamily II DNA or RNA helicase
MQSLKNINDIINISSAEVISKSIDTILTTDNLRGTQVKMLRSIQDYVCEWWRNWYIKSPTGSGKSRVFLDTLNTVPWLHIVLMPTKDLKQQAQDEQFNTNLKPHWNITEKSMISEMLSEKTEKEWIMYMTYRMFVSLAKTNAAHFATLISQTSLIISDEIHKGIGEKTTDTLSSIQKNSTETENQTKDEKEEEEDIEEILTMDQAEEINSEITQMYSNLIHIGFTATPSYSFKSVKNHYDEICNITLQECIEEWILLMPETISTWPAYVIPKEQIHKKLTEWELINTWNRYFVLDGKVLRPTYDYIGDVIIKNINNWESKNILGACASIKHAEFVKQELEKKWLRVQVTHAGNQEFIEGESLKKAKQNIREWVIDVTLVVGKWLEGWDVPELDTLAYFYPTTSPVKVWQGTGRITRIFPEKKHAKIIMPTTRVLYNNTLITPNQFTNSQLEKKTDTVQAEKATQQHSTKEIPSGIDIATQLEASEGYNTLNWEEVYFTLDEFNIDFLRKMGKAQNIDEIQVAYHRKRRLLLEEAVEQSRWSTLAILQNKTTSYKWLINFIHHKKLGYENTSFSNDLQHNIAQTIAFIKFAKGETHRTSKYRDTNELQKKLEEELPEYRDLREKGYTTTPEQILTYLEQSESWDATARDALISAALPCSLLWVMPLVPIIETFDTLALTKDDLISEATLITINIIDTYIGTKNKNFFASTAINVMKWLLEYIHTNSPFVNFNKKEIDKYNAWMKVCTDAEQYLSMNIGMKELECAVFYYQNTASGKTRKNVPSSDFEKLTKERCWWENNELETELKETILWITPPPIEPHTWIETKTNKHYLQDNIESLLQNTLSPLENKIISEYYWLWLNNYNPSDCLELISEKYGLSLEIVKWLKNRAIRRLKIRTMWYDYTQTDPTTDELEHGERRAHSLKSFYSRSSKATNQALIPFFIQESYIKTPLAKKILLSKEYRSTPCAGDIIRHIVNYFSSHLMDISLTKSWYRNKKTTENLKNQRLLLIECIKELNRTGRIIWDDELTSIYTQIHAIYVLKNSNEKTINYLYERYMKKMWYNIWDSQTKAMDRIHKTLRDNSRDI